MLRRAIAVIALIGALLSLGGFPAQGKWVYSTYNGSVEDQTCSPAQKTGVLLYAYSNAAGTSSWIYNRKVTYETAGFARTRVTNGTDITFLSNGTWQLVWDYKSGRVGTSITVWNYLNSTDFSGIDVSLADSAVTLSKSDPYCYL